MNKKKWFALNYVCILEYIISRKKIFLYKKRTSIRAFKKWQLIFVFFDKHTTYIYTHGMELYKNRVRRREWRRLCYNSSWVKKKELIILIKSIFNMETKKKRRENWCLRNRHTKYYNERMRNIKKTSF